MIEIIEDVKITFDEDVKASEPSEERKDEKGTSVAICL